MEESGIAVQTDLTSEALQKQLNDWQHITEENLVMKNKLLSLSLTLCAIYNDIQKYIPQHFNVFLDPFSQLLLTLMKLRLNLDFTDIAYRFGISNTTASNYFFSIIDVLYERYNSLIIWPDREVLQKTVPECFCEVFKQNVTIIIDCFEIFIQKPSNFKTNAQCWSNYKHHNTIKFLIGITPQGTICFISEAWGGRASDKFIVENSNFLNYIMPNDVVLVDRGFLISDALRTLRANLVIPAFMKGKKQLCPLDIENTRNIAHVRIHVERIIGMLKQVFSILQGPIPISMLSNISAGKCVMDKVVVVCGALINLQPPIVPL